ncbi:unnamed protein product [Peniophora sp. CBMAI 1063]|nr:unnamed protein product [Peniophora sp. CBMAI 1063]
MSPTPGYPGYPPQQQQQGQYPPPGYGYPGYPYIHGPPLAPAPASTAPASTSPSTAFPSPQGNKRKRDSTDDGTASEEPEPVGGSNASANGGGGEKTATGRASARTAEGKKRTKTSRACDSCRTRKIRCDVLTETDPPLCQHCKQYGFECTFFLPIGETRFKKKKVEEQPDKDKDAAQHASPSGGAPPDTRVYGAPQRENAKDADGNLSWPGNTSEAHLLHSSATIPSRLYESYDARHHHSWSLSASRDGFITVREPAPPPDADLPPRPADMNIARDVVEQLLNAYFKEIAPVLPIITREEFLSTQSPPPILLYSMCLVAAARRSVPQSTFEQIRYAVNAIIKAEDVLSTATIANVQALLILCMVGDCHSQFVPNALSALWIRLGTTLRMAQDLGLHRAEAVKQNIELRRRLWCMCVISDRWMSLSYGHPYMIDVGDCDARLPSSDTPDDLYTVELVRLSILLGRVLKTIYSPSGLNYTTDEALQQLLSDIETWRTNLPEALRFRGPETPRQPGLLFLLYACINMIFWRVFMRISYTCPAHLRFQLSVEKWSALVEITGQAIDWLDKHDSLYDVWMFVAYAATSCALVQYHTWARRQDATAAQKLKTLRDCIRRWERSLSPDHMSARRKTAEIIALLYEATQGPPPPIETPALNPTVGAVARQIPATGNANLQYVPDPERPGSGVFVAQGDQARETYKDVPGGVTIPEAAPPQPLVNYVPLARPGTDAAAGINVNPALTGPADAVPMHVVNTLDPTVGPDALQQLSAADTNWLEGIPGGMFDWGQWDEFFARLGGGAQPGVQMPQTE